MGPAQFLLDVDLPTLCNMPVTCRALTVNFQAYLTITTFLLALNLKFETEKIGSLICLSERRL